MNKRKFLKSLAIGTIVVGTSPKLFGSDTEKDLFVNFSDGSFLKIHRDSFLNESGIRILSSDYPEHRNPKENYSGFAYRLYPFVFFLIDDKSGWFDRLKSLRSNPSDNNLEILSELRRDFGYYLKGWYKNVEESGNKIVECPFIESLDYHGK